MSRISFSILRTCLVLLVLAGAGLPLTLKAGRSKEQLLSAREQVSSRLEVVAFKRIPNVVEKRRNERGRLVPGRTLDHLDLRLGIVRPPHVAEAPPRPAVLFFHGGGFRSGGPEQFLLQADLFAAQGAVAFCVEYRLKDNYDVTIAQQVDDARSAIRWVRQNAVALHVDPEQVVAVGGSAGGYLALASAVLPGRYPDAVPDAVVLFNPAIDFEMYAEQQGTRRMEESLGGTVAEFSGTGNLRAGLPPMLLFHGEADEVIPVQMARTFAERAQEWGNVCELVVIPGEGHGFHNRDPFIEACAYQAFSFLRAQGFELVAVKVGTSTE